MNMKKIILTFAAAVVLALGACAGSAVDSNNSARPAAQAAATAERSGTVITLKNDRSFRPGQKVKRLTILDFNATWCGPCRKLAPVFHDAAKRYRQVDFISVDVDKMPATAAAFGVQAVPTVVFISPDGTQRVYTGTNELLPASALNALIDAALKK